MSSQIKTLFLPALRASMGDWIYYSTIIKFRDINERIRYAKDIHESKKLQDLIQRSLTPRAKEISDYLISQPQRFFNSLIVGVYGGEPQWIELEISKNREIPEFPLSEKGILGFLKLTGKETLFALDGQHRVAGIKGALDKVPPNSDLFDEEISVIFIGHKKTQEGKERTRRLFTTLNRYAKPVKLSEIIALDEDDIAAIITRDLVDEYELFKNSRLSIAPSVSIPKSERECFTNIVTLYRSIEDILQVYLKTVGSLTTRWKNFQKKRPDQEVIDKAKYFIKYVWDEIIKNFLDVYNYLKLEESEKNKAVKYRHDKGGHILFRPIGVLTYINVISTLLRFNQKPKEVLPLLTRIETKIENDPWKGLFWESAQERMITRKENQKVARNLTLYMIGFDLRNLKTDKEELLKSYASLLNKELTEVTLPQKII